MPLSSRVRLVRSKDLVLGNLLERLAEVHGDRPMVEEAGGGLALTFREAAELVAEWAGGIAERTDPGDSVVIATANGYEQLLLVLAASRAGQAAFDPVFTVLQAIELAQLFVGALGVITVTGEYASGLIRGTFVATPQRAQVLARRK